MRILATIIALTVAGAGFGQELPAAAGRTVSYAEDVHPILAERCYKCHTGDELRGEFDMSSRDLLLEGSKNGEVVKPGDSAASRLIIVVSGLDPEVKMPPKGDPLSEEQIGILRAWIDQGLEWDSSMPVIEKWKAPLLPRRPEVPAATGIHGSDHPIDRFMRSYFEEKAIEAPALVSGAEFARRASLDAIGLLPTLDECQAFFAPGTGKIDPSAGSDQSVRSAFIEALLARDRDYAEHWMTFWNDALRNDFTGTGYIDGGRRPISQWLYDALYYNKPYDQFTRELIHPSDGSRGFTDGIVWRGVTAAAEQPPVQAARSVSQVFLGVNLKCASCHDSFIDNWKLADSYGMANFYADSPLQLVRCDSPLGAIAPTKFLWPELGGVDGTLPEGTRTKQLAELITKPENGRFTRTIVNRVWAELMGRGIVEPLDQMHKRPWNPDLLDWLATEFVDLDYDLRALMSLIMSSRTYQLASDAPDPEDFLFRGPEPRRLSAEEFLDAVSRVTGVWQEEPKFSPPLEHVLGPGVGVRAWRIPSDPLTRALGRPNRELVTTRRQSDATRLQAIELTNGATLSATLAKGAAKLDPELPPDPAARVATLYLRALQRDPSEAELELALGFLADHPGPQGLEDLLWAMVLLPEFQVVY